MATTNGNPDAREEIRIGIANACLMMPDTAERRAEEMNRLYELQVREKDLVAEAKDEAGVAAHVKRLNKVYGVSKAAIQIMKILDKVEKPGDRAAVLTQVGVLSKSVGYCDKDLVTLAQEAEAMAGQQADDQGSVFDNTTAGQRGGSAVSEPRHVEQGAAAAGPAPTPGIPLDEALVRFEEAKAKWSGKGRKPKAMVEAQAVVDAARAAQADGAEAADQGEAIDVDPLAEKPEAAPGQISSEMREANAEQTIPRAPKPAVDLQDDLPPPAPKKGAPLAGATGQGSYTLN